MAPTTSIEAIALGVLQGLTEFLPVSSDGHLGLAQVLFGIEGGLALTVTLHAGTFAATVLVLRRRVVDAIVEASRALASPARFRETAGGRDALAVLAASVPTAAIGLGLREAVERWTTEPLAIGLGLLATACVLTSTRWAREGEADTAGVGVALLVGLAQGLAVLPGLSRSGSTIALALFLGVRRERAFELSMLMSLPAVFGALVLEAPKALRDGFALGPALAGAVVAFVVGVFALLALRRVVVRGAFAAFALWVFPLSLATLALAWAWP
ncbi:MAG: undecaprenyl-diphosphate phosphatase [Polyangiaceae bacterium]|nr:undecaprenyl-diphosphate phosphatase [Polyangiaceae bacterium]